MQPSTADGDLAAFVRGAIAASLASGMPTIPGAAMAAGLSVRSLQRRLAEAGLTYSQLREEVHRDTALRLIADRGFSLSEISAALGYSDPAHFTRAFVRWTGQTPRAYSGRDGSAASKRRSDAHETAETQQHHADGR